MDSPHLPSPLPIHVLIVGAGAVGAFYGSRLHQPTASPPVLVSLICRSNYLAVARHGISLSTHSFSDYHFSPHKVFPSVSEAAGERAEPWDYVVVTTKALPDVVDDSETIEPVVRRGGERGRWPAIVLIQNGVGLEEPHRARFPEAPIVSAVTVVSAEQMRPGVVKQNRWTRISLGPYVAGGRAGGARVDPGLEAQSADATELLERLLKQGGIKDAESYDETGLQLVRWHKLAINASMNPSAVLSGGVGNASMSVDPNLREHLSACMSEILTTAPLLLSRPFPPKFATVEQILRSSERNTDGKPSMLVDWEAGRPMELEVILGNPVRLAKEQGLEMPRIQSMYALLKMAQEQRQKRQKSAAKL